MLDRIADTLYFPVPDLTKYNTFMQTENEQERAQEIPQRRWMKPRSQCQASATIQGQSVNGKWKSGSPFDMHNVSINTAPDACTATASIESPMACPNSFMCHMASEVHRNLPLRWLSWSQNRCLEKPSSERLLSRCDSTTHGGWNSKKDV